MINCLLLEAFPSYISGEPVRNDVTFVRRKHFEQSTAPPSPQTMAQPPTQAGATNGASNGERHDPGGFKLKSMESHLRLAAAHYPVISFGTGSLVRLPGPSIDKPNVYQFNKTSYDSMYKELESKDPRLYRANGLLNMLERNRNVKWGPERWQDWQVGAPRLEHSKDKGAEGVEGGVVDVVITCEERCWDAVIDDLMSRGSPLNRPVHVINVDIKDNHEEALVGGRGILDLADSLNEVAIEERERNPAGFDSGIAASRSGFDERVPEIIGAWQERWPNLPAIWTLAWF
ncbi:protein SSU72 [Drepanopeziza brunnea f. sp. 'multigermtubi' MB_m1]|uniref:RNA polymerase II subunit A C-terminal domain phosphatase SSU72 n=1 Tax=Marssonina brunnea f. sp. multigermtubi (strain MB_m1) TaxID=1072389 RepID=K1XC75_MARBU|nr:protein SSU72 [Drepanopeziza brunnea f. sp. 'multigermtubi' MB_m1]EKD18378.1 protein SSU72 [Drepanopeziza brunnea f. sp. 'multigermtubi' MB_m1]